MLLGFPTIFTPQGDGNLGSEIPPVSLEGVIPDNIYPARGRKHQKQITMTEIVKYLFPTIFTPQGDGNAIGTVGLPLRINTIPDNIYPARGRKHSPSYI